MEKVLSIFELAYVDVHKIIFYRAGGEELTDIEDITNQIKASRAEITTTGEAPSWCKGYSMFLALEYCSGTLFSWLERFPTLETRCEDQNIPVMLQQIVDGVRVLHDNGIIHRLVAKNMPSYMYTTYFGNF